MVDLTLEYIVLSGLTYFKAILNLASEFYDDKITSSILDFCHSPIDDTTITTCRWHFVGWLLNSHSDVVMVAEVGSECLKSHSDGVLIEIGYIEHNIQVMANIYTQLNVRAVFFVKGRGNLKPLYL